MLFLCVLPYSSYRCVSEACLSSTVGAEGPTATGSEVKRETNYSAYVHLLSRLNPIPCRDDLAAGEVTDSNLHTSDARII